MMTIEFKKQEIIIRLEEKLNTIVALENIRKVSDSKLTPAGKAIIREYEKSLDAFSRELDGVINRHVNVICNLIKKD